MENNLLVNNVTGEVKNAYGSATLTAQAQKELATIQVQAVLAKQNPRDIMLIDKKVEALCGRKSLAEVAEYEYTRGGNKIQGATIKLLEAIAGVYGNIQSGYKTLEIDYNRHVAKCYAYAWDIENNVKNELEFEVQLKRTKKDGSVTYLEDERDISEMISNWCQRRRRKCLEQTIPADIVDKAREECNKTLKSNGDYQKDMDKCIDWLNDKYGIKIQQIEELIGMGRQAFTIKAYQRILKICSSIKDGMLKASDIFVSKETEKETLADKKEEQAKKVATKEFKTTEYYEQGKRDSEADLFGVVDDEEIKY